MIGATTFLSALKEKVKPTLSSSKLSLDLTDLGVLFSWAIFLMLGVILLLETSNNVLSYINLAIGEFKSLSPGVYQATHYLNKNLPNLDSGEYKIASFISGFGTTDDVFDLAINEKWYANSAKRVEIVFSCSSNMLLNIIFSFIVYPDVHPILTFTYDNRPDGDGSYHISGPVGYWDDRSIRYDEWRV